MKQNKVSFTKPIKIFIFFIAFGFEVYSQDFKHSLYLQGLSYTSTNVPEVGSVAKILDYNFGYNIEYKNFVMYLDKFQASGAKKT